MSQIIFYIRVLFTLMVFGKFLIESMEKKRTSKMIYPSLLLMIIIFDLQKMSSLQPEVDLLVELTLALAIWSLAKTNRISFGIGKFRISGVDDIRDVIGHEIFENVDEAVIVLDQIHLKIVASNASYQSIFEEKNLVTSMEDILSQLHRDNNQVILHDYYGSQYVFQVKMKDISSQYKMLYFRDVSELEKTKNQLGSEESLFISQWNLLEEIIVLRNAEDKIIYMNPAAEIFFEKKLSYYRNKKITDLFDYGEEGKLFLSSFEKLEEKKFSLYRKYSVFTSLSGRVKYFQTSETLMYYKGEKCVFLSGSDYSLQNHMTLLYQSYQAIEKLSSGWADYPVFVVDLIENTLIYHQKMTNWLDAPIHSFKNFMDGLTKGNRKDLENLKAHSGDFQPFEIIYRSKHKLTVEKIFKDPHGHVIGYLIHFKVKAMKAEHFNRFGLQLVEHISEGVLVINSRGEIEFASPKSMRILQYSKSELESLNIVQIVKGLSKEMLDKNWRTLRELDQMKFDRIYENRLGEELPMEVTALPIHVNNDEKMLLLLQPHHANCQHSQSHVTAHHYDLVFNALDYDLTEISLPEKNVFLYDAFHSDEGFVGKEIKYLQWLNAIHDYDRSIVAEKIDQIILDHQDQSVEYRYFKNGDWEWYRTIIKYMHGPETQSVLLINHLITESKAQDVAVFEQKQMMDKAEKLAGVGFWKYIISENAFNVSSHFKKIMGVHTQFDRLHYEEFLYSLSQNERAYFEHSFYQFIWKRKALDIVIQRKDNEGKTLYIQIIGKHFFGKQDKIAYAIGVVKEITEHIEDIKTLSESVKGLNNQSIN